MDDEKRRMIQITYGFLLDWLNSGYSNQGPCRWRLGVLFSDTKDSTASDASAFVKL